MGRLFAIAVVFICSISAPCQSTPTADSQILKAMLEELRLLRQDLQTTTIASQRVQIVLYRLQLQDAAVSRASKIVDDAHSKLSDLSTEHDRVSADMQRADQQKVTTQDPRERKAIEDEVLPQLKQHLERIARDEQQWQAKSSDAEGQLKAEQTKLDGLHSLLDELDRALENVGHSNTMSRSVQH